MSLPNYIVNIDEFNKMFSSFLNKSEIPSIKNIYSKRIDKEFLIEKTDLGHREEYLEVRGLIYAFKVIQSSFLPGDLIKIRKRNKETNDIQEIEIVILDDGYLNLLLEMPIGIVENEELFIEYENRTSTSKRVMFEISFLEVL